MSAVVHANDPQTVDPRQLFDDPRFTDLAADAAERLEPAVHNVAAPTSQE